MNIRYFSTLLMAAALSAPADAGDALHWQSHSVTLLYGDDYEVVPPEQTTLTLEHASGWVWGDMFGFVDFSHFHNSGEETAVYGEITPRLSLSWLTDSAWSAGPISDTLLVVSYEAGRGDVETLLAGAGVNLEVPGFSFLKLNLLRRFPQQGRDGETTQLTPSWAFPIALGRSTLMIDGYIDWVLDSDGSFHENLHINPQVKLDVSPWLNTRDGQVWLGIEYDYWQNKFGIESSSTFDTDQSTFSVLLKVFF